MSVPTDTELGRLGYGPKTRALIRGQRNQPHGGRAKHTSLVSATEAMEQAQARQYPKAFDGSPGYIKQN
jgi:hypothetical protein